MAGVTLNGTTFYPSNVEEDLEKYGAELRAKSGKRRWIHRAHKRSWKLSFDDVPLSVLTALRTVATLTTTFTFVDENANSYTVLCTEAPLSSGITTIGTQAGVQVLLYSPTLQIYEA
jgi:hypothetical protein